MKCPAASEWPDGVFRCELPFGHLGYHLSGATAWAPGTSGPGRTLPEAKPAPATDEKAAASELPDGAAPRRS